jgi:hypothetical protein
MDYNTLVGSKATEGSIKYWINHSELPASSILADAQAEIYARLRVREMLVQTPLAITVGMSALALPDRFLDPESLSDNYRVDVSLRSPMALTRMRWLDNAGNIISGPISNYAIFSGALQFDMASNINATFSLIYFESPAPLSGSNPTNFLTDRYSHLLRAAILKHAYAFRKSWDEARALRRRTRKAIPGNRGQ